MKLEIAAPVFNEAEGITDYLNAIENTAGALKKRFPDLEVSLLLADDGSVDGTSDLVSSFRFKHLTGLRLIRLSRNFGNAAAISALIDNAMADALVLMDADLQDDPVLIVEMVQAWREGAECVRIARRRRKESLFFRFAQEIFYRVFSVLTGQSNRFGTYGLYGSRVYKSLRCFPERLRYFPGLVTDTGFKTQIIFADRNQRNQGTSRMGFKQLARFAMLGWFSYSNLPIHIITGLGLVISILSFFAGLAVVGIRIATDYAIPGWSSILAALFFMCGLIILSLGVVGQYVGIIFSEVKRRPLYFIDSVEQNPSAKPQ